MSILRRLLEVSSGTEKVKEAMGFNPANVGLIEGNGVTYGFIPTFVIGKANRTI